MRPVRNVAPVPTDFLNIRDGVNTPSRAAPQGS